MNHLAKDDSKSFIQTTSSVEVVPIQLSSKPIIKPWEEIQNNKNRRGLGYVNDDTKLHIPDYSKLINFFSARFLAQITSASFEKVADNRNACNPQLQSNRDVLIVKEPIIWKINFLIFILVAILASPIIPQRNVATNNNQPD